MRENETTAEPNFQLSVYSHCAQGRIPNLGLFAPPRARQHGWPCGASGG